MRWLAILCVFVASVSGLETGPLLKARAFVQENSASASASASATTATASASATSTSTSAEATRATSIEGCTRWSSDVEFGSDDQSYSPTVWTDGTDVYQFGGCTPRSGTAFSCSQACTMLDLDTGKSTSIELSNPSNTSVQVLGGASAYSAPLATVFIFGGQRVVDEANEISSDTSTLSSISQQDGVWVWSDIEATGDLPPASHDGQLIVLGEDGLVLGYFGGKKVDGYSCGFYTFNTETNVWTQRTLTSAPSARMGHSMTALPSVDGVIPVIVFGGFDDEGLVQEEGVVHVITIPEDQLGDIDSIWESVAITPGNNEYSPEARGGHSATLVGLDTLVFVGGCNVADFTLESDTCYDGVKLLNVTTLDWMSPVTEDGTETAVGRMNHAAITMDSQLWSTAYGSNPSFAHYFSSKVFIVGGYNPVSFHVLSTVDVNAPCLSACRQAYNDDGYCVCDAGYGGKFCEVSVTGCDNSCNGPNQGVCTLTADLPHAWCECVNDFWGEECGSAPCPHQCSGNGYCSDNDDGTTSCDCTEGMYGAEDCSEYLLSGEVPEAYQASCPNNCTGHGICYDGVCLCQTGYNGEACDINCPSGCSGHGSCDDSGLCECDTGYTGLGCENTYCDYDCTSGVCVDDKCYCEPGYVGVFCEVDTACAGHGIYSDADGCVCDEGYGGLPHCSQAIVCNDDCNGKGVCTDPTEENYDWLDATDVAEEVVGVCECNDGYTGSSCQYMTCPDDCSSSDNGVCSTTSGICSCYPGYGGDNCNDLIGCPSNCTCATQGTCQSDATCLCVDGFTGDDCGDIACMNDCSGNGDCINGICFCDNGYSSDDCSVSCPSGCSGNGLCFDGVCECAPTHEGEGCELNKTCTNDCGGNGVCHVTASEGPVCVCQPGWEGDDCSTQSLCDACVNGVCELGLCFCLEGYTGDNCDTPDSCHGLCSDNGLCDVDTCVCFPGYSGDLCEIYDLGESSGESASSYEVPTGIYELGHFWCAEGWTESTLDCTEEEAFCVDNTCSDYGVCAYGHCHCVTGRTGDNCELNSCPSGCTDGQGVCLDGTCYCIAGYTGDDCSATVDCPVAESSGETCNNRGACVAGSCACLPGFTGETCEHLDGGFSACPKNCSGAGTCIADQCVCLPGRLGFDCSLVAESQELTCLDDCNGKGQCMYGQCFCDPGFHGDGCLSVDCPSDCSDNGICTSVGTCHCAHGWEGETCNVLSTPQHSSRIYQASSDEGNCPNACSLNGVCIDSVCECAPGYQGDDCSLLSSGILFLRCPNNCNDRGTCHMAQCDCDYGYTGDACELDVHIPCINDCNGQGACVLGDCVCDDGFDGDDCALIQSCDAVACGSHGVCYDGVCVCANGFTGEYCDVVTSEEDPYGWNSEGLNALIQEDADIAFVQEDEEQSADQPGCGSSSCGVNGFCVDNVCYCSSGWQGDQCQQSIVPSHRAVFATLSTSSNTADSLPLVYVGLACFLAGSFSSIVMTSCVYKREQAERHSRLKPLLD